MTFVTLRILVVAATAIVVASAFTQNPTNNQHLTVTFASGRGFGKSYGDKMNSPIKDLIDVEEAMNAFFSTKEEWHPLFRTVAEHDSVPAMSFLVGADDVETFGSRSSSSVSIEFHESSSPWRKLEGIPSKEKDREVLANFLDNMQKSLIEIPVDESIDEDENDLDFIEEGRRLLVLSRFHVLQDSEQNSIESYDELFSTCWSEIMHLRTENSNDTGSLILVPGSNINDLRRFCDMNLQRPLEWLGMNDIFEVTSMKRGSPAIRLIHKLSDIPAEVGGEEE